MTFLSQAKNILLKGIDKIITGVIIMFNMKCLVRQRREELGFSQGELARKVGCAREQINRVEKQKIKNPGIELCKKIAEALYVDVDKLWV